MRAATRHQVPAVKAASPAASLPLAYGGGQVLRNPSVYISYWGGAWPAQAQSYLQTLFTSLGASTWLQPLTQYSDGTGSIANPSTLFQNTHTWVDSTAVPSNITDADVTAAGGRAASHFGGPAGSLYYVLTPPGQSEAGFGVNWCAWHSNTGSPFWYPSAWVNYAMEFIPGGYYLHDAPWRSWYGPGSNLYDGTHGCVNIPLGPMTQLYAWANVGDEVIVQN